MAKEIDLDCGIRPHGAAGPEFDGRFAAAAGVSHAALGAQVALVREALEEGYWAGHGIHSPVHWLMWRGGLSRGTARAMVRLALRAHELPTTIGLLTEGRLSLDQATTIARYVPGAYEASVCELAVNATVAQIARATATYAFDTDAPEEPRPARREVSFGTDHDGQWWARVRLAADEGAVVEEALSTVRDHLHDCARKAAEEHLAAEGKPTAGKTDAELGVEKVGWADALVGMANATLTHGPSGAEQVARHAVHLHLEQPEPGCGTGWVAELQGGPAVPDWLRRQLTCDCDVEVVLNAKGIPVATYRSHRTPPRKLRRLVERRDGYCCRVPGCDQRLWLQVHHIIHWEDGGETLTGNLCCLCTRHHRLHHQGLLGITGDADAPGGLTFTTAHGLVLDPAGASTAPSPRDMPRVAPYEGPCGERLRPDQVTFNPTEAERPPAA